MPSRSRSPLSLSLELVRAALEAPSPLPPPRRLTDDDWPQPAAVVLPIRFGPVPEVVAVVRARHLKDHAGEVGFPGGKLEGDENLQEAALRETHEEIGLEAEALTLLGTLAPIPVVTGRYLIHPFVASIAEGAEPRLASSEAERLLRLPILPWITGERRHAAVKHEWRGNLFTLPHFEVNGRILYGASAIIFYELLARIADQLGMTMPEPELEEEFPWAGRYED